MGIAVVNLNGDHVDRVDFAVDVVVELGQVGGQREDNLIGGSTAALPMAVVLATRGYSEIVVMVLLPCVSGWGIAASARACGRDGVGL